MSLDARFLPSLRWSLLRTTHVGGYLGATETMCREVAAAEFLGVTRDDIRDQLDYLERRKLADVTRHEIDPWRVRLTRYGTDLVEYQVECDAGIRRPPRIDG